MNSGDVMYIMVTINSKISLKREREGVRSKSEDTQIL